MKKILPRACGLECGGLYGGLYGDLCGDLYGHRSLLIDLKKRREDNIAREILEFFDL